MSKPISASPNHASGQRNGTAIIIERLLLLLLLLLLSLLLLLQHGVSKLERCRYDVGANDISRQRCPGSSPPLEQLEDIDEKARCLQFSCAARGVE